jgi:hypothetical protein
MLPWQLFQQHGGLNMAFGQRRFTDLGTKATKVRARWKDMGKWVRENDINK